MTSASALYVLHETAAGYALFDVVELDEVASLSPELQKALADRDGFKRICKLRAFVPFASAEMALENINAIAEHSVPDRLKTFLETNLPAARRLLNAGADPNKATTDAGVTPLFMAAQSGHLDVVNTLLQNI